MWIKTTKGVKYTLINDGGEYQVSDIGSAIDNNIVIGSTYNNLPVTSIGDDAFYDCGSNK